MQRLQKLPLPLRVLVHAAAAAARLAVGVASLMPRPLLLVGGRNALDSREARAAGIRYRGFGRG
jgi:hypothetical protein